MARPEHVAALDPTVSTEETRKVAERLAASLSSLSEGGGEAIFSPDVRLWVSGDYWWSGELDAAQAGQVQGLFHQRLVPGTLQKEVRSIIAEHNRAALELRLTGQWHDGRDYASDLHVAIDVRDGKIVGYREYSCDTRFFALEPEPA